MSHLQEQANKGMNPASVVVDPPAVAGRTRVKVESLGVSARGHVRFSYRSAYGDLILVDGELKKVTRGVGVTSLKVDRLWFAVPVGTLVTIETGEIR